jgi:predicted Zn finger-like uncharacterized protein
VSLATRCSACSTVFRVQKDQLKASEGWVRCGRCGTVFSALEGLFDLERESHSGPMPLHSATPAAAPPSAPSAPPHAPSPAPHAPPAPAHAPAPPLAAAAAVWREADEDEDGDEGAAPTPALPHDESLQDAQSDRAADRAASMATFRALQQPATDTDDDDDEAALSLLEHSGSHTLGESRPHDSGLGGPSSLSSLAGPPSVLPSFAREPDSAVRWRQQLPVVRRLTIAAALALPLLLAAQVALHHRDMVAARWPGTAEVLRAVCASLNCSVQAPRALDALTVESSGLTRVEGSPLYRLQVALRNRAAWAVAMPTLDVTLTDARGEVVARRALRPDELAVSAPAELGAGAEWSATATLDVGERRITGYTIDLFYP